MGRFDGIEDDVTVACPVRGRAIYQRVVQIGIETEHHAACPSSWGTPGSLGRFRTAGIGRVCGHAWRAALPEPAGGRCLFDPGDRSWHLLRWRLLGAGAGWIVL
jgi:hypothetical protein